MPKLEKGWIFPDGTYVEMFGEKNHTYYVKAFLRGLKSQNQNLATELEDLYERYENEKRHTYLYDDFAIKILGWIKVGAYFSEKITYAGYSFQALTAEKYSACGWGLDCLYIDEYYKGSETHFLPLQCDWKNAIEIGKTDC